jgi:hypothetical protein
MNSTIKNEWSFFYAQSHPSPSRRTQSPDHRRRARPLRQPRLRPDVHDRPRRGLRALHRGDLPVLRQQGRNRHRHLRAGQPGIPRRAHRPRGPRVPRTHPRDGPRGRPCPAGRSDLRRGRYLPSARSPRATAARRPKRRSRRPAARQATGRRSSNRRSVCGRLPRLRPATRRSRRPRPSTLRYRTHGDHRPSTLSRDRQPDELRRHE